jgi:hypothetical protein
MENNIITNNSQSQPNLQTNKQRRRGYSAPFELTLSVIPCSRKCYKKPDTRRDVAEFLESLKIKLIRLLIIPILDRQQNDRRLDYTVNVRPIFHPDSIRRIMEHANICKKGFDCPIPQCRGTKCVLDHWKYWKKYDCIGDDEEIPFPREGMIVGFNMDTI